MEYRFKLVMGDWSGDGHGKHEDFIITSNKPIEHVRAMYFKACDVLGWKLDDHNLTTADHSFPADKYQQLQDLGIQVSEETKVYVVDDEWIDLETLVDIILATICTQDPELEMKVVDEGLPNFHFCGYDEKQRHIGCFGYELLMG